jgi:2-polyprenyl-3-methyl-5-hydroxy-6-metoxy-1,4-benzoquinol methylase
VNIRLVVAMEEFSSFVDRLVNVYLAARTLKSRRQGQREIIRELSKFAGLSPREVWGEMQVADAKLVSEWERRDPKDHEQILEFYRATRNYVFDLADYDYFAFGPGGALVRECMAMLGRGRVLDYGGGIGDMTIRLANRGCSDLTYYDVSGETMKFARWRFAQRGLDVAVIEASDEEDRLEGKYNTVFCLDVLEHVCEPLEHAERLVSHLSRRDGRLFLSVGKPDPEYPMHISTFDLTSFLARHRLVQKRAFHGFVSYYAPS